jgi:hypothetical protein
MADKNYTRLRGQRLSPILWQGGQWAVTAYGIEARDGSYTISKDRLGYHREHPRHEDRRRRRTSEHRRGS